MGIPHFRFWTLRNGCQQSIVAGAKGVGKTQFLDLLASIAVTSTVPVVRSFLTRRTGSCCRTGVTGS